jgi:peptide/nickel transport system permease protein
VAPPAIREARDAGPTGAGSTAAPAGAGAAAAPGEPAPPAASPATRRAATLAAAGPAAPAAGLALPDAGRWWRALRGLGRVPRQAGGVGFVILAVVIAAGVFAPWIAPHGYDDQDFGAMLQPPVGAGGTWSNALGTDPLGRDLLSRIVHGARTSLLLALVSVAIAGVFGIAMGLVTGWVGGRVDAAIMAVVEVQLSLPYLLFAIAFMALFQPGVQNLIIVLVLRSWVVYAQLIRVAVLSMKQREFVTVATALGASPARIVVRHILPNVVAPALVVSTFQLAELIIVESSLSFLGLGVQPPLPSWGGMLSQGREYISSAWWLVTFPGLAIILTVLGANLTGDAVRDLLDPRLRGVGRPGRART